MARAELDALVDQSAARLRQGARDPGVANRLRQHPILYEVFGRWPPDPPLRFSPAELVQAVAATRQAADALSKVAPDHPLLPEYRLALSRLNETAAGDLSRTDVEGGEDAEDGAAGGPEEIVGRWPPD